MSRRVSAFWIGFLLTLASRAAVAASRLDDFRGEELYQGSLAGALLAGMPLDPESLPVIVHMRGSLVFGVLAAPLFALLGPSYAALKVLACLWSAATGGILAWILGRVLGARAAYLGAALFALMPPAYLMVDTSAFGSHLNAVLPILLALALLVGGALPLGPLGALRTLAFGAAAGFGVFFSLQVVVALPALLAAWLAVDPRFFRRRASLLALAGAAPFLGAIRLVSSSSTLVTKPLGEHVLPEGLGGLAGKLGSAFGGDLVRALLFEVAGGAWAGFAWALAALVVLALLAPRVARLEPLAVFALAHPALVIGAYAASDFELNFAIRLNGMGSRYLMPMVPALVVALVLGVELLLRRPGRGKARAGATALAALALVPGLLGFVALLDPAPFFDHPPRKGTNYPFFAVHFRHAASGMRAQVAWMDEVDPDWAAYRPLAYAFVQPPEESLPPPGTAPSAEALAKARGLSADVRPFVLAALGTRAAGAERARLADAMAALPEDAEAAWVLRGLGRGVMALGLAASAPEGGGTPAVYRALAELPARGRDELALGAGFQLGHLFTPYHEGFRALVAGVGALPAQVRRPFVLGLALGWRLRFRESSFVPPAPGKAKIELLLPAEDRPAFRAALEAPHDGWGS